MLRVHHVHVPSDTSCGEEIKVAAKSGTCSALIVGSSFPLHVASRKPLFIFEVSNKPFLCSCCTVELH